VTSHQIVRWALKPAVFLASLVPFMWLASAVAMLFCSFVMFDLVRNMFHTDVASHTPLSNFILSAFK